MSTATTELPGLLRGCVKWRDGRAWVDNDALLVLADWCEENGNDQAAGLIRDSLTPDRELEGRESRAGDEDPCGRRTLLSEDGSLKISYHVRREAGSGPRRPPSGSATIVLDGELIQYTVTRGEIPPKVRGVAHMPPVVALERVRDLARWHCICHMLGYPPLRLVGEE